MRTTAPFALAVLLGLAAVVALPWSPQSPPHLENPMTALTRTAEDLVRSVRPGFVDPFTVLAVIEAVVQIVKMYKACRDRYATPADMRRAHPVVFTLSLNRAVSRALREHGLPQDLRDDLVVAADARVAALSGPELAALVRESDEQFPS